MFRKTDTTTRVRPNFREVCVRALIAGAALSAMTAVNGALGHVVALAWDSCSASCASDIEDGSAIAWEAADDQATLSLIGRIPPQAASLFDRETVPEVLAAGLPSALFPNKMASAQDSSGFDYFFSHPDEIGAPGLFLSADSLTGQFTLGEFLSESHDYFSETLSLGQTQIPTDMNVIIVRRVPREASFSTEHDVASPKKATRPTFPSTDLSLPASQ
jgi:hypothetical protein